MVKRVKMTQKNELEEKLIKFFDAENNRDWNLYETLLSQNVEWISYGPPKRKVVIGKEDYVKTMIRAYRDDLKSSRFLTWFQTQKDEL